MPSRWFFVLVIGAILFALAIMGVIVWVEGDDQDQGNTGHDPYQLPVAVPR